MFGYWVRKLFSRQPVSSKNHPPRRPRRRLQIEALEDRTVPATFAASGNDLLLNAFASGSTITVAKTAANQITITLTDDTWSGTDGSPAGVSGNGNAALVIDTDTFGTTNKITLDNSGGVNASLSFAGGTTAFANPFVVTSTSGDFDIDFATSTNTFTSSSGLSLTTTGSGSAITDSTGSVVVNGGPTTLEVGTGNNITLDSTSNNFGTVTVTSSNNLTLADASSITLAGISAATSVSITAGTSILDDGSNSTRVVTPTLSLTASNGSIGDSGANNEIDTTVNSLSASSTNGSIFITESDGADFTATASGTGDVQLVSSSGTLNIAGATNTDSGAITLISGDAITLSAALGDSGTSGTITILANNDAAGAQGFTQNAGGTIQTSNSSASAVSITVSGSGGAVLRQISTGTTGTTSISVGGNVTQAITSTAIVTGTLNIIATGVGSSSQSLIFDTTSLSVNTSNGNGDQFLSEVNSTSVVSLNAGTVSVRFRPGTIFLTSGTFILSGNDVLFHASKLNVNGGTLAIDTFNNTVDTVILTTGSITGTTGTLTSTNTFDVQNGSISAILGGSSGLTKSTTGLVTLDGANTYSGNTTINGGTLLVNGSLDSGSAVSVNNTGTLGGTGTINGSVTANNGSTVAPGTSPGILSTGNLDLGSGSTLSIEIGGTTPGNTSSNHDQVNVTGSVSINTSAVLSVSSVGGFTPSAGQVFIIINNDGTDAVTGNFSGLAEGDTFSTDFLGSGLTARITYRGGDGNDVALVVDGAATFSGAGQLMLRLDATGVNLQFLDDGVVVDSRPLAGVTMIGVNGANNSADTLTIDYANGVFLRPISFNGGTGTGSDTLSIANNSLTSLAYTATGPGAGTIVLNGSSASAVNFTNLEPVTVTSALGTVTVTIGDDGNNHTTTFTDAGGGQTTVTIDGGLESMTFTNPTVALIVNGANPVSGNGGNDSITFTSLDAGFNAAVTVNGNGGTDSITLNTALNLGSGTSTGAVSLTAESIDINQAISTTAVTTGTISLSGTTINLGANLSTDGAQISIAGSTEVVIDAATVTIDTESGNDGNAGAVTFAGTGLIRADAANRNLVINTDTSNVGSSNGSVTLAALGDGGVAFVNNLTIDADDPATTGGTVTIPADSQIAGTLMITAGPIMSNASFTAGSSTTITLVSDAAITDGNGVSINFTAGSLAATASTGIGASDALETAVGNLEATTSTGGVGISNTGNLTIGGVSGGLTGISVTTSGDITVSTSGTLTVSEAVSTASGSVSLSGNTTLNINAAISAGGSGTSTVNGGSGSDTFNVTATGTTTLNLAGAASDDVYNITLSTAITSTVAVSDSAGSNDTVNIDGVSGVASTFTVNGTSTSDGTRTVTYTGVELVDLDALDMDDVVNVTPSSTVAFDLDGGTHTTGDTLTIDAGGAGYSQTGNVITVAGMQGITFSNFETVSITNPGDVVVNGTAGNDTLTLQVVGGNLQYTLNGVTFGIAGATGFEFNGLGGDDLMTVNFAGGDPIPTNGVRFDGQGQTSATNGDRLTVTNGTFTLITVNHVTPSVPAEGRDGNIVFAGFGTITFTGLEPVLLNVGSADDIVFNLPDGGNNATLEDGPAAGQSQLRSTDATPTFEVTAFTNPANSLTINGGNGADNVTVSDTLDDFAAALRIVGNDGTDSIIHQEDDVVFQSITYTAETINIAASILTDFVSATPSNGVPRDGSVTLTGSVTVSATVTIDTEQGGDENAGAVTVTGPVTLGGNLTINTDTVAGTDGNVSFVGATSTINADDAATQNRTLAILAGTAVVTFGGTVGNTQALADLDVTAATINLNAATFTIDDQGGNTVTFNGAVILGANVTIDTDGTTDNNVTFNGTVNADDATAQNRALTVMAGTGTVTFGDNVGNTQALADLDVTAGTINLGDGTPDSISLTIDDQGGNTITFNGAVVLGANVTIDTDGASDNNVTFNGTVNADDAANQNRTLTILSGTGIVTFGDNVGNTQALADLDVTAATINLGDGAPASITFTVDDQGGNTVTFTGAVVLQADVTIDTDAATGMDNSLSFVAAGSTVNADAAANMRDLSVTAGTGDVNFGGAVGNTQAVQSLRVNTGNAITLQAVTTRDDGVRILAIDNGAEGALIDLNGTINTTAGAVNGNVCLNQASGTLTIDQAINAGTTGIVRLVAGSTTPNVAGSVTQTAAGVITADELGVFANGSVTLCAAANDVNEVAIQANGLVEFSDIDDFRVGDVAADTDCGFPAVSGISSNNGNINLRAAATAAGTLTINTPINAGTGDLRIRTVTATATAITQIAAGIITADEFGIQANGAVTLNAANNDVNTLGALTSGALNFNDVDDLTVNSVAADGACGFTGVVGLDTNGGALTLTVGPTNPNANFTARAALGSVGVGLGVTVIQAGGRVTLDPNGDPAVQNGNTPLTFRAPNTTITISGGQANGGVQIVSNAEFTTTPAEPSNPAIVPSVRINGGNGIDAFRIRPSQGGVIRINGQDPTTFPGDTISVISITGVTFVLDSAFFGTPNSGRFVFTPATFRDIQFINIETVGAGFTMTAESFLTGSVPQLAVSATFVSTDGGINQAVSAPAATSGLLPSLGGVFVVNPNLASPSVSPSAPRVAVGDVNRDGVPDVVIGQGPANDVMPLISVVDGRFFLRNDPSFPNNPYPANAQIGDALLSQFLAYDPNFRGGMFVAVGDLNNDGFAEIVTGADAGGGPHVKTFTPSVTPTGVTNAYGVQMVLFNPFPGALGSFFGYDPGFRGGVRVAIGDVDGNPNNGKELILGAGAGGGSHVKVFNFQSVVVLPNGQITNSSLLASFFAFDPGFRGGVYVGAGNLTAAPGDEIVIGAGIGGGPHIKVINLTSAVFLPNGQIADSSLLASFFAPVGGLSAPLANIATAGVGSVAVGAVLQGNVTVPAVLVGTARGQRAQAFARLFPGGLPAPASIQLLDAAFQDGLNIGGFSAV